MNEANATFEPTAGSCYGHAWKMLWKNFLELLLIGIITVLFSIPINGFSLLAGGSFLENNAGIFIIPVMVYGLMILAPLGYGLNYAFLKAVRGERLQIRDLFAFTRNYWNTVLANILATFIIGIGFVLLVIPGIVFACKLVFVPYLVIDRKMEAISAIRESWRMTDGFALNIFYMGLLAILLGIAGIIVFFVGSIIAAMWIYAAFASMYFAVDSRIHSAFRH